jgi:hypothetical protein
MRRSHMVQVFALGDKIHNVTVIIWVKGSGPEGHATEDLGTT